MLKPDDTGLSIDLAFKKEADRQLVILNQYMPGLFEADHVPSIATARSMHLIWYKHGNKKGTKADGTYTIQVPEPCPHDIKIVVGKLLSTGIRELFSQYMKVVGGLVIGEKPPSAGPQRGGLITPI